LSAAFKKMAIIHQRTEENTADDVKSETVVDRPVVKTHKTVEISAIAAFSSNKKSKKVEYDNPDQISLFDLIAS